MKIQGAIANNNICLIARPNSSMLARKAPNIPPRDEIPPRLQCKMVKNFSSADVSAYSFTVALALAAMVHRTKNNKTTRETLQESGAPVRPCLVHLLSVCSQFQVNLPSLFDNLPKSVSLKPYVCLTSAQRKSAPSFLYY